MRLANAHPSLMQPPLGPYTLLISGIDNLLSWDSSVDRGRARFDIRLFIVLLFS